MPTRTYLIQPKEAEKLIADASLTIIDLCHPDNYARGHVPGAINLDYRNLVHGQPPAPGFLPNQQRLQDLVDALGISPDTEILAYDDEGNGKASRFLWVLDSIGYHNVTLLDGGMHSWANEGHTIEQQLNRPTGATQSTIAFNPTTNATKQEVLAAIEDPNTVLLDARSPEEYGGQKGGARFGHIPSAVNMNWLNTLDQNNNMRFRSDDELLKMYADIGVTPDKTIIAHCQTHHRSSHSYAVLKHLGFKNVKGYSGSWAEWSSDPALPIVTAA